MMHKDILEVRQSSSYSLFQTSMRNQRQFNLNDEPYLHINDMFVKVRIIGVYMPLEDNSEYLYKVQIPEGLERELRYNKEKEFTCKELYHSKDEAKQEALKQANFIHYKNLEWIENFFK
jgi:hypothetical protein